MNRSVLQPLVAALAAAGLAGCVLGPDPKTLAVETPPAWSAADAAAADPQALAEWWRGFEDPELDSLVARTLAGNLDLQSASARIAQARAQRDAQFGGLFPSLSGTGSYKRYKIPDGIKDQLGQSGQGSQQQGGQSGSGSGGQDKGISIPGYLNIYQLGFDASWELDLWGGARRGIQAANASLAAQVYARRGAVVSVLAELGTQYGSLRGTQARIALAERNLAIGQQLLELTQDLAHHGFKSDIDVAQARGNLETTRASLPPLKAAAAQAIHAIAVLVGVLPESLETELGAPGAELHAPPSIPAGLPSQLLANRPDIRQADDQYVAATAQVGVATAQRLPSLSLTGSTGYASGQLDQLVRAGSWTWNIGASVTAPIFDAGRLQANQRAAEASATQQEIAYRKTVLQAFGEVEDGLGNVGADAERDQALDAAIAANRDALNRATDQYRAGLASYIDVLDSERSLNSNADQQLQARQQHVRDLVAVYKALGGGWQAGETEQTGTR